MRSVRFLFVILALGVAAATVRAESYTAYLSSAQEVPTNASTATGFMRLRVNPSTLAYTWSLTFTGLSSNQTASHIHGSAAIGANAGVLIDLGSTGATAGTLSGSGTLTAAQYTNLRSQLFYVNVHSASNPGGEIRGQLGKARPVDRDGDGRTDQSVLRFPTSAPQPITYYVKQSTGGFQAVGPFGDAATDFPAPGDYDGDFKDDITLYRAGATAGAQSFFYTLRSSNNVVDYADWGVAGDQPISRDYDGDGKVDYAVFRDGAPGTPAVFWIIFSSTFVRGAITWGTSGDGTNNFDTPVPADYDGDGKVDVAVYRFALNPNPNTFIILRSSDNGVTYQQWGNFNTDYIVPGDYDGDGKADFCAVRTGALSSSPMVWWILQSSNGQTKAFNFGISSDAVVQGDYDGDGRTDAAVNRQGATTGAQNFTYVFQSLSNTYAYLPWGIRGDFAENQFDTR